MLVNLIAEWGQGWLLLDITGNCAGSVSVGLVLGICAVFLFLEKICNAMIANVQRHEFTKDTAVLLIHIICFRLLKHNNLVPS